MAIQNTVRESTKVNLCTDWMELESDPGLFTLLLEDIGVKGVKVEEVYDVTQKFEDPVFGYVFLFQWVEERRVRKKAMNDECYITEPSVLKNMFFAHQIVTNSCATHALLSILLNCEGGGVSMGHTLEHLKQVCKNLDPESRGYAIGNTPELAIAHNRHAKPAPSIPTLPASKRGSFVTSMPGLAPETFHFVSYVPIGERLFELDGLKQWPIDHGPWAETEDWTDLFKRVISKRLAEGDGIQFNLMALIPDPLPKISQELTTLQARQKCQLDQIFQLAQQVLKSPKQEGQPMENGIHEIDHDRVAELIRDVSYSIQNEVISVDAIPTSQSPMHTKQGIADLDSSLRAAITRAVENNRDLEQCKRRYQDELETRKQYQVDAQRRTHDYDRFFEEYFKALAVHKLLPPRMLEVKKSISRRGRKPGGGKNKKTNGSQRIKSDLHLLANGTQ